MKYTFEKMDDNGNVIYAPAHDLDGQITGRCVYGLQAWFDENPEERKRLGWVKHIKPDEKDVVYDKQTQFLVASQKYIDEYTIQDEYKVLNKTETMMAAEEEMIQGWHFSDYIFAG